MDRMDRRDKVPSPNHDVVDDAGTDAGGGAGIEAGAGAETGTGAEAVSQLAYVEPSCGRKTFLVQMIQFYLEITKQLAKNVASCF